MPYDCAPLIVPDTTQSAALALARQVETMLAAPERWCKKQAVNGDARCLLGALHTLPFSEGTAPVVNRMKELCGRPIAVYNDDPATTHPDIVALTRAVTASFE